MIKFSHHLPNVLSQDKHMSLVNCRAGGLIVAKYFAMPESVVNNDILNV